MAKPTRRRSDYEDLPELTDSSALATWLREQPLQWSTVIAVRAALRTLPLSFSSLEIVLSTFRAASVAHFSAKHPNSAVDGSFTRRSLEAAALLDTNTYAARAVASAASTAAGAASARAALTDAGPVFASAAEAVASASNAAAEAGVAEEFLSEVARDMQQLRENGVTFDKLIIARLWHDTRSSRVTEGWHSLIHELRVDGDHWSVWINWYNELVVGQHSTEIEDAVFAGIPRNLPWNQGSEAVNVEIARRLGALHPDPAPIEGISSPITISRKPDGRIGVEPGPFSLPSVPPTFTPDDHRNALTACRSRAAQLTKFASSPEFQGRSEYAQILGDYLEWLPSEQGTGNVLLADGEARTLNKLFTAEEGILPTAFASKLSVLLEDHIALRSFYPEIERHYHAVNTGRLVVPLSRDAVQAIQKVILSQTPTVFDETVSPAITEAAKPIPDIKSPLPEDIPPADPSRPKPPNDPIAEADPQKSRSYIIASAYNRIWSILQKGKETAQAIEGWQKAYDLLKPHIGAIIDFLRHFQP